MLTAVVQADGTLVRGSAVSAEKFSSWYEVAFNRSIAGCAFTGTGSMPIVGIQPPRIVSLSVRTGDNNALFVETFDLTGTFVDTNFHLMVVCP